MTNVKSLLALYLKMGGSLTDTYSDIAGGVPVGQYSTISDAILACTKKYSSGGGLPADFPAEGAANKNKFLGFDNSGDYAALDAPQGLPADFPAEGAANANKVIGFDNSGDYAAITPSAGVEKFVVTLTEESGTWTADDGVTVADVVAAVAAGKICEAVFSPADGVETTASYVETVDSDGVTAVAFQASANANEAPSMVTHLTVIGVSEDDVDTWLVNKDMIVAAPTFSVGDIGKVLGVISDGDGGATLGWVSNS